jgi:hypothetical protein
MTAPLHRNGEIELPLMYLTGALFAAFAGAGAYSVDGLVGLDTLPEPMTARVVITVAVAMALLNVALRRSPYAPARTHA